MATKKKQTKKKEIVEENPSSVSPKLFEVYRKKDKSGVSGTGKVCTGVIFPTGKCCVSWEISTKLGHPSIIIFESFRAFELVHIESHPENGTEIIWLHK